MGRAVTQSGADCDFIKQLVDLVAEALAPRLAAQLSTHSPSQAPAPESGRLVTLDELVASLPKAKRPETWKRWLYERTRRGEVPGCVKLGGTLFFDAETAREWIFNGTPPRTAEHHAMMVM
jgi:hypothetical protein